MTPEETERRLDEIEGRCEAATPGPWDEVNMFKILRFGPDRWADHSKDQLNARFIAYARDDIPELLALARRALLAEKEGG